ncbi:DUF6404 family protein [Aliidiomarina sp. Khilg15.8]
MFLGSDSRRRQRNAFDQHKNAALAHLAQTPLSRGNYQPLPTLLLWMIGARVRPPHFQGFAANLLTSGLYFAIVWGLLMWFILFAPRGASPLAALQMSILVGLLYGAVMAFYYRHSARKHRLPSWESLRPK